MGVAVTLGYMRSSNISIARVNLPRTLWPETKRDGIIVCPNIANDDDRLVVFLMLG